MNHESQWNDPPRYLVQRNESPSLNKKVNKGKPKIARVFHKIENSVLNNQEGLYMPEAYKGVDLPKNSDLFFPRSTIGDNQKKKNEPIINNYINLNNEKLPNKVQKILKVVPLTELPSPVELDKEENYRDHGAPRSYFRSTMGIIPGTVELFNKINLPFSIFLTPYVDNEEVPLCEGIIIRCEKCRAYINKYIDWIHPKYKYKCSLCKTINDIPQEANIDKYIMQRPEITNSVVEFAAGKEYMSRSPQANYFLFLIDVSWAAINSGMVSTAARTIKESIENIPNSDGRSKVGFLLFDAAVYFINLDTTLTEPQILSVNGFTNKTIIPFPNDVLVGINEGKANIEIFLDKLAHLFTETQISDSIYGSALKIGFEILKSTGGKIISLISNPPSKGLGIVRQSFDSNDLGTSKETKLLELSTQFYKNLSIEMSVNLISVDLFVLGPKYVDLTNLIPCSRYTGGSVFMYPKFNSFNIEENINFAKDLNSIIIKRFGMESVLRIRVSKGLMATRYHGNFFNKQTDLLAISHQDPSHSYGVEFSITDSIQDLNAAYIQMAHLNTNVDGERRIRVITAKLDISNSINDIIAFLDPEAMSFIYLKKAIDNITEYSLSRARNFIFNTTVSVLKQIKNLVDEIKNDPELSTIENFKSFPLLMLGAMKSPMIQIGPMISPDIRTWRIHQTRHMNVPEIRLVCFPKLYPIHEISSECGIYDNDLMDIPLPPCLLPTFKFIAPYGIYLLDIGWKIFICLNRKESPPELIMDLFIIDDVNELRSGLITFNPKDTFYSNQIYGILYKLEHNRKVKPSLELVCLDENSESLLRFSSWLILDKFSNQKSYQQWLLEIKEKVCINN